MTAPLVVVASTARLVLSPEMGDVSVNTLGSLNYRARSFSRREKDLGDDGFAVASKFDARRGCPRQGQAGGGTFLQDGAIIQDALHLVSHSSGVFRLS
jgi:hypothetical protein